MSARPMNPEEARTRHKELHQALDELLACYINTTGNLPSETSVLDLGEWSHLQTVAPACTAKGIGHQARARTITDHVDRLGLPLPPKL